MNNLKTVLPTEFKSKSVFELGRGKQLNQREEKSFEKCLEQADLEYPLKFTYVWLWYNKMISTENIFLEKHESNK